MKFDRKPWIFSLIGICILFLFHFFLPTMINGFQKGVSHWWESNCWNHSYGESLCLDRIKSSEFFRRPIMYKMQQLLFSLGIPYQFSFTFISFICFYFTSIFIYKISLQLGIEKRLALISIAAFYSHFTILFAFFGIISTYDEPIMYLFLVSSIYYLLREKMIIAIPLFIVACIARETSFLIIPLFLIIPIRYPFWQRILFMTVILVSYILYINYYIPNDIFEKSISFLSDKRIYAWQRNFKDLNHIVETFISLFISIAIPLYWLIQLLKKQHIEVSLVRIIKFTIVLFLLNSSLILVAGLAIEARLFALPMILAWPIIPIYFSDFNLRNFISFLRTRFFFLFIIFLLIILGIKFFYVCSEYTEISCRMFKVYVILYIQLFISLFLFDNYYKNRNQI